jgi:hypothetical protein
MGDSEKRDEKFDALRCVAGQPIERDLAFESRSDFQSAH